MRKLLIFCLLVTAYVCSAQPNSSTFGTVYAADTNLCTPRSCVYYAVPDKTPWVVVNISGTWSGSLQIVSISDTAATYQNLNTRTWTTLATVTTNGTWSVATGGAQFILIQAPSWTSGRASVTLTSSLSGSPLNNPIFSGTIFANDISLGNATNPVSVKPSGDTTGGTDCARIQNACTAGASVQLFTGTYYVGKSNASCNISNICKIQGQGSSSTIIQNEGTTNDVLVFNANNVANITVPYVTPYPSGGVISGFRVQQDSNVIPSAGSGVRIGTNGSGVTEGYLFSNVDIAGTFYGVRFDPGFWNVRFTQSTISYPAGLDAIYYDSPANNGDVIIDNIFIVGNGSSGNCTTAANVFINRGDTGKFKGVKINCGNFVFGTGASSNFTFTDIGVENGGLSNCAFDFSAGSTSDYGAYAITALEFETGTTGASHLLPDPVCAPQNVPTLSVTNAFIGTGANNTPTPSKVFNTPTGSLQAYDNFTGLSGIDIGTTDTNTVQPWVQFFQGTWNSQITLNGSNAITGNLGSYYLNMTPLSAQYTTSAPCTLGGTGTGWCILGTRLQSPSSSNIQGYACLFQKGTGLLLEKFTGGGSPSQLGSTDSGTTSGTHIVSITSTLGNVHTCYLDGKASSTATASDSTYTSAGFPWIAINQGGGSGYTINQPFTVQ